MVYVLRIWFFIFFCGVFEPLENICKAGDIDITFYNVGQGDCTIVKYPNNHVLFVDAGTSDTRGIEGIDENDHNKMEKLAVKIVNFIQPQLESGKWLFFIVTHSDKDHLNLIPLILTEYFKAERNHNKDEYTMGCVLGGSKNSYQQTGPCKALLNIIADFNIPHIYGGIDFKLGKDRLYFVPKIRLNTPVSSHLFQVNQMLDLLDLQFLSVHNDVVSSINLSRDDISNAESIVLKIKCGDKSLMITGDKTKNEIAKIMDRFRKEKKKKRLKADILLATHHGSDGDFSQDWVDLVQPYNVIFSAGFSTHLHPRSSSIKGYLYSAKKRMGAVYDGNWHLTHFYGENLRFPLMDAQSFCSILNEHPLKVSKPTGYTYAVTNLSLFTTGIVGQVSFKVPPAPAPLTYHLSSLFPSSADAINALLANPTLPNHVLIKPKSIYLDGHIVNWFLCKSDSLTELSLRGCLTNAQTDALYVYIIQMPGLIKLDLNNNVFSPRAKKKIKDAWGYRGLTL